MVIWPFGSTAPLSTQKPCEGAAALVFHLIGQDRAGLALDTGNSCDGVKLSLALALMFDDTAVTTGVGGAFVTMIVGTAATLSEPVRSASLAARSSIVPPLRLTPEDDVANAGVLWPASTV